MTRRSLVLAAAIWSASVGVALSIRTLRAGAPGKSTASPSVPAGSIYGLSSVWQNDFGTKFQLSELTGKYLVVAIFTRCPGVCPTLVRQLLGVERRMSEDMLAHAHFALFSIDPEHDTVSVLHAYRERMGLDARRWTLCTTTSDSVRELGATLGFAFGQEPGGMPTHSKLVTLLDRAGKPILQRADISVNPDLLARAIETALEAEGAR